MAEKQKLDIEQFALPEGRVCNHSLFVKDKFNDKATASYKIEVAIYDDDAVQDLEDKLCEIADMQWGAGAGDNPDLILPLLDGDVMAAKREAKDKEGGAYKGATVVRCNTIFNHAGDDDAGGIQVYDENVERIEPVNSSKVYNGCYGIVGVSVGFYKSDDGHPGIKLYLSAFQKTRDGDKLGGSGDRSNLFKPVATGGKEGREGGRRRRRRG